jgi:CBS domain containing-hemolysin-like protein
VTWVQTQLAIAGLAIVGAFLTSAWVNAISRISRIRAARLAEEHPKRGKYLEKIADNPPVFLTSVLIVMLILRVTATVLITVAIMRLGVRLPELIAIGVMTFVLFQLAEIAPRTWVLERLDQVLLGAARPVYWIGTAFGPLTSVLVKASRVFLLILPGRGLPKGPLMSEEEIKSILDVAESEEVIEAEEREMIHSIFEFSDTVVREVMVPRPDMVCVEVSATLEEVLQLTLKSGFSRVPVIANNIDNVVGIVYQKDVVKKLQTNGRNRSRKASEIKREAHFVPESKKVSELLREMQQSKTHMVIVVDEYGGVAGLATLEDLLEEIVGEIEDEHDVVAPGVKPAGDGSVLVEGSVTIRDLNRAMNWDLPDEEAVTVAGLLIHEAQAIPEVGQSFTFHRHHFRVEARKGARLTLLRIEPPPDEDEN